MLQNPHLARALSPCGAAWPACCDADPIRSRARDPADSFESFRQSVESFAPGRAVQHAIVALRAAHAVIRPRARGPAGRRAA